MSGERPKKFVSYAEKDLLRFDVAWKLGIPRKPVAGKWIRGRTADWFFAHHSLQPGADLEAEITRAIGEANQFLLLWSRHAAASGWVKRELALAKETKAGLDAANASTGSRGDNPPPFFQVYLLDDTPLDKSTEGFGFDLLAHDWRLKVEWPTRVARPYLLVVAVIVVVFGINALLPDYLEHVAFYAILPLAGGLAAVLWGRLGEPARALVCASLSLLALLDFIAWWRLKRFDQELPLQVVDSFAYAALLGALVFTWATRRGHADEGRRLRPATATAALLSVYAALACVYWLLVDLTPVGAALRGAVMQHWQPNVKAAWDLIEALPASLRPGEPDHATAWITILLYAVLALVAAAVGILAWRASASARGELRTWQLAAWLSAIPPAVYILLGPWCGGGLLWLGDGASWRAAALTAYLLLASVGGWFLLHGRGTQLPSAATQ